MPEESQEKGFYIPPVPPEQADAELASIYQAIAGARGSVANILTCTGANPPAVEAHFSLYRTLMFGSSPLSRAQRETIAVAVSRFNHCHY